MFVRGKLITEMEQQVAYQRKLTQLLGRRDAVRFRTMMLGARLSWPNCSSIRLHPPTLLHPVELRLASTDAEVYGQVLMNKEYAPIADRFVKTIVDCGANVGLTSAYLLSQLPDAQVVAIEPFPANAEICRRNLAPYGSQGHPGGGMESLHLAGARLRQRQRVGRASLPSVFGRSGKG